MGLQKAEMDRLKALLVEAVGALCKKGINYDELCVDGLIGITVNKSDVFLVKINQKFNTPTQECSDVDEEDDLQIIDVKAKERSRPRKRGAKKRKLSQRSDEDGDDDSSINKSFESEANMTTSTYEPTHRKTSATSTGQQWRDSDTTNEVTVKEEPPSEDMADYVVVKNDPDFSNDYEGDTSSASASASARGIPNFDSSVFSEPADSSIIMNESHMMYNNPAYLAQGDASSVQTPGSSSVNIARLFEHTSGGMDEKLRTCEICGRTMQTSSHLRQHMQVHTGEKPHQCPLCSYCSNRSYDVRRHMAKKHQDMIVTNPTNEPNSWNSDIKL